MGEQAAIDAVAEPVTIDTILDDLRSLGVEAGDVVLVHASLSAMGWVCGGPPAVVDALQQAVGESGTLVMPTHTSQYSHPAGWSQPPVPESWVDTILTSRPPYRPEVTPARGVGAIPECFRSYPGVHRSQHPIYSFAAWGADAAAITDEHCLDFGLDEGSPLQELYDRHAQILMIGTDYKTNTSIHLAEYRTAFPKSTYTTTVPISQDGNKTLIEITDYESSTEPFPTIGSAFETATDIHRGDVGAATSKLLDQRALVDFAIDWYEETSQNQD